MAHPPQSLEQRIAALRVLLAQTGDGILRNRTWLQDSLTDPLSFASALFASAAADAQSPMKSQFGVAYDFYHDAVARHATGIAAQRPAFVWAPPRIDDVDAPYSVITYAHLNAAATVLAAVWKKRFVRSGDIVAIIYPMGPELLIALCAALRLGLVISVLPPLGPDFLSHRLTGLQPKHVITARRYHGLLREWYGEQAVPLQDALLEEVKLTSEPQALTAAEELASSATEAAGPQPYGSADLVFGVFSAHRTPSWTPLPVTAAAGYLGSLCDGVLLGLSHTGSVIAAPHHHQLTFQPTLLLLGLLHGATYLHIDAQELAPDREREHPKRKLPGIDILLVGTELRDELLKMEPAPTAITNVGCWVAMITESGSTVAWKDFIAHCGLGAAPALSWYYDAAAGGCQLFSLRQRGQLPLVVYPSPGRPFLLADPTAESEPARGPNGILRPLPGSCGLLLYEHSGGYLYGGTRWPSASGRSLSVAEVELAVATLPYVAGAVVVPTMGDRGMATLLTFVGPHMQRASQTTMMQIEHRIREQIRTRLGVEFVPTRVQVLAALPRRTEQGIDVNWCMQQLREGRLEKRALDPALHLIDRLIFACHRVSTPAGFMTLVSQYKK